MTGRVRWVPPPLPDDPREIPTIRTRLIILAILGVVAMVTSMIARGPRPRCV